MNLMKKNMLANMLRTAMALLFPLVTFPYVSRVLGPESIGKIGFAQSIVNYGVMIASLGIANYGMREAAKVKDNRRRLSQLIQELLTINIVSSCVAYLLLFCALFAFSGFQDYRSAIMVCSASILFTVLGLDWLFYVLDEIPYVAIRSFAFQVLGLVLLFVFVRSPQDYLVYAGIGVVSSVGSNVCNFFRARKYIDCHWWCAKNVGKHILPILSFFIMTIASTINSSLDTTMLGFLSNDEQVGYYTVAQRIVRLATAVATATTVVLPRLSYFYGVDDMENFRHTLVKSFNALMIFIIPSMVGLYFVASPAVLLFAGSEYTSSVVALKVLAPCIFALGISNIVGAHLLLAIGKERRTLVVVACGVLCNALLNCCLVPRYGSKGAAVATTVAELLVALTLLVSAKDFFVWKCAARNMLECAVAAVCMGTVLWGIAHLPLSPLISLFVMIVSGCLVYGLSLIALRNEAALSALRIKK